MSKLALIVLSSLAVVFGSSSFAWAALKDYAPDAKAAAAQVGADLTRLEDQLRAKPEAEWSVAEMQEYLKTALTFVYHGKTAANYMWNEDTVDTAADLTLLVDRGYLPYWPSNPFDEWKPMPVMSVDHPFTPGALVFQSCPPEFNSGSRKGGATWPVSFNLFVYGPGPEFAEIGMVRPMDGSENAEWTRVPEGAMYSLSMWMESAKALKAKYERAQAAKSAE